MAQEEKYKAAFENLQEHLRWMVREGLLQEFGISSEPGLPPIKITAIPAKCKDCGDKKNISTEQL